MDHEIRNKYDHLLEILREKKKLAVAFSGGVDSTFLLYAAKQALGDDVTAFTVMSVFSPERESREAEQFCAEHGIRQVLVTVDVLKVEGIAGNPVDRCYLCKKALFGKLLEMAKERGIDSVAEGSNLDDMGDYRPGMKAIGELKVLSPLREAELTKAQIRRLSREFGLATWEKPSFACLASRFVHGEPLTGERLRMVAEAEEMLRSLGFVQFRVRIHADMARIEVLPEQFERMLDPKIRMNVTERMHSLGFSYVSMDLDGYRTGSMNPRPAEG